MPSDNNNPPHTPPPELPSGLNIVHSSPPGTPKMRDGPVPAPPTRAELLDSAQKFLESAPIMNAPLREKLEFLKTKGLTRDEMEALMEKLAEKEREKGVVVVGGKEKEKDKKKEEGGKEKEKEKDKGKEMREEKADKGKGKELVKASSSTSTSTSTSTAVVPFKSAPSTTTTTTTTSSSSSTPAPVAPIVTYPEFLTPAPPAPPAPLMTAKTLGKSLYFATGAAATIYGANKFVLTPMYDALTSARLDLSSTALANLATLNTRLTELLPEGAAVKPRRSGGGGGGGGDSDSDSDTSDPGELFHVDASTQTSADLGADLGDGAELSPDGKLERLGAQLQTLVESHSDGTDNELTFALEDLTSYLETLTYDWPGTNIYTSPYGGYGGGAGGKEKDKDDPVAKVKAEIRSVKGVLLNSKNFPASR